MKIFTKLFILFVSIISLSIFYSCEDIINVKLANIDLNLFGVEAEINTQREPTVFLYKTLQVNQNIEYPGISGATVTINDNSVPANTIILKEETTKKGFYIVPKGKTYKGEAGKEYTITIVSEGVTLTAKEKLATVSPIDSMEILPSNRGNRQFFGIFTSSQEPKGLGNFYKWDIYVNDSLLSDAIQVVDDKLVDGKYINRFEIFTDFHEPKKPEKRKLNLHDTVYVEQTSISEFAYNFYFQMVNQTRGGGMFSVPSANIKGNFTASNGKTVLGMFVARDISKSNSEIINERLENQLVKESMR